MAGTITESQWILALCAFLLLVAEPPISKLDKALDAIVFTLCSLTGPFCIVLFLIAIASPIKEGRWHRLRVGIFFAGSLLQVGALLMHDSSRIRWPLGAGP